MSNPYPTVKVNDLVRFQKATFPPTRFVVYKIELVSDYGIQVSCPVPKDPEERRYYYSLTWDQVHDLDMMIIMSLGC